MANHRAGVIPLVLNNMIPVKPRWGGQPMYIRGKHSVQTSARLAEFHTCMADALSGKTYPNRKAVRDAFTKAAKSC